MNLLKNMSMYHWKFKTAVAVNQIIKNLVFNLQVQGKLKNI